VLRAFVPDLDNRLGTITELHTEISKQFAAAGIEIAFPQRDIHVRSDSDKAPFAASEELPDSQDAKIRGSERSLAK